MHTYIIHTYIMHTYIMHTLYIYNAYVRFALVPSSSENPCERACTAVYDFERKRGTNFPQDFHSSAAAVYRLK